MRYAIKTFLSQKTVALLNNDGQPFAFYSICQEDINLNDIYCAKITAKAPCINGYFAEIDYNRCLFIETKENLQIGQKKIVIITKEERLGKIPQAKLYLTTNAVPDSLGLIQKADVLEARDSQNACDNWQNDFDDLWQETTTPILHTKNGARIFFEPTHAFCAIDIDSDKSSQTFSQINEECAFLIAQEIIRKNLSGNILIDFIGYKNRRQQKHLIEIMTQGLAISPIAFQIFGFSPLGNLEIRRNRTRACAFDATRRLSFTIYQFFEAVLKNAKRIRQVSVSPLIFGALNGLFQSSWKQVQEKAGFKIPLLASPTTLSFDLEYKE